MKGRLEGIDMCQQNHRSTKKAMRAIKALARRHGVSELPPGSAVFTEYRGAPTIVDRLGDAPLAFVQIGAKGNWLCIAKAELILDLHYAARRTVAVPGSREESGLSP